MSVKIGVLGRKVLLMTFLLYNNLCNDKTGPTSGLLPTWNTHWAEEVTMKLMQWPLLTNPYCASLYIHLTGHVIKRHCGSYLFALCLTLDFTYFYDCDTVETGPSF